MHVKTACTWRTVVRTALDTYGRWAHGAIDEWKDCRLYWLLTGGSLRRMRSTRLRCCSLEWVGHRILPETRSRWRRGIPETSALSDSRRTTEETGVISHFNKVTWHGREDAIPRPYTLKHSCTDITFISVERWHLLCSFGIRRLTIMKLI